MVDVRRHNADYGFDGSYHTVSAPGQAVIVGVGSAALLMFAARSRARGKPVAAAVAGATAASLLGTAAVFVHTTRVGKFAAWAEVLKGLRLHGDETLLDLGCGRGAVLLAAAKLLPNGRAIGVDVWRADQTDNSPDNTLRNAALENVADRVEVHTADITDLPFDDNSVDVIVSSLVIHNISEAEGRGRRSARRPACCGQAASWPSPTSPQPTSTSGSCGTSGGPPRDAAISAGVCGGGPDWPPIWSLRPNPQYPQPTECGTRGIG